MILVILLFALIFSPLILPLMIIWEAIKAIRKLH